MVLCALCLLAGCRVAGPHTALRPVAPPVLVPLSPSAESPASLAAAGRPPSRGTVTLANASSPVPATAGRVILEAPPAGRVILTSGNAIIRLPQRVTEPTTTTAAADESPDHGLTAHEQDGRLLPVADIFRQTAPGGVPLVVYRTAAAEPELSNRMFPGEPAAIGRQPDGAGPWPVAEPDWRPAFACSACCTCGPCGSCRTVPLTFRDDRREFLPRLRDDALGVLEWENLLVLGAALGGSIAMRQDLDDEIREDTARHPERWGDGSRVLGRFGEVQYQVPAMFAVYGVSLYRQDPKLHDMMTTMISAYTLTGLSTLAVKGIANTDRPSDDWNDGQFGFPSFHVGSTATIAAVAGEYYGWRASLPLYAMTGLIGWSRIDERDHDLSDVVFGAALGYVIGKSVAGRRLTGDSRLQWNPWIRPDDGTTGLMLEWPY